MDSWLRFFHLAFPGFWLGAAFVVDRLIAAALKADQPDQQRLGLEWARRLGVLLPSIAAAATLVSGVLLLLSMGLSSRSMPLWFKVMERGGGSLALLTLGLLGYAGVRLKRALEQGQPDLRRATIPLVHTLRTSMVLVTAVLLTVALRLR